MQQLKVHVPNSIANANWTYDRGEPALVTNELVEVLITPGVSSTIHQHLRL